MGRPENHPYRYLMNSMNVRWYQNVATAIFAISLFLTPGSSAVAAPVDPGTLSPYVLLDANRGVVSGGVDTTVTAWRDQSANGFLFQSDHPNADSNDPTLTSGPNFTLAIEFDGSDIIDSDSLLQLFTTNDSALTVFAVMSPAGLPGNQQFLMNHAPGVGGDSFELGPDAGQVQSPGAWGIHRGGSQATSTSPDTLTAGSFDIMTAEVNSVGLGGSNVAFFRNGEYQPNASGGWLSPGDYETGSDPLAIGARVDNKGQGFDELTPDSFFNGQLSELIVFRDRLSTADRQGVEEFLGGKYNITVTQTIAPPPMIAPPPIEPPTPLQGDIIGDDLIPRQFTDSDSGAVYIFATETFTGTGFASAYAFFGPIEGRYVTPLILEVVRGSIDDNDAVFRITGIGESIMSDGSQFFQQVPFVPLAGSDQVSSKHTFGHFDGEVAADGAGGVNVISRNQGSVSAGGAADGDWAFSGGGQVPFDLDIGETFATFVDTGGSGELGDPIKVFSRVDGNGRSYSAQMSAVPEPLVFTSIEVDDQVTTVTLTWNSRPGRSYTLESSESLATQTRLEIDDGIASDGPTSTTFIHNLLDSYPEGVPPSIYYRITQN
jgi:hypothetical protein